MTDIDSRIPVWSYGSYTPDAGNGLGDTAALLDTPPSTAQALQEKAPPSASGVVSAATSHAGARFKAEVVSHLPSAPFANDIVSVAAAGFRDYLAASVADPVSGRIDNPHTYPLASLETMQPVIQDIVSVANRVMQDKGKYANIIDAIKQKSDRPFDADSVRAGFNAAINQTVLDLRSAVRNAHTHRLPLDDGRPYGSGIPAEQFVASARQSGIDSRLLSIRAREAFSVQVESVFDAAVANAAESVFTDAIAKHEAVAAYKDKANGIIDEAAQGFLDKVDADSDLSQTDKTLFKEIIGDAATQVKRTIEQDAKAAVEAGKDPEALRAGIKDVLKTAMEELAEARDREAVKPPNDAKGAVDASVQSHTDVSGILDEEAKSVIKELADGNEFLANFMETESDQVKTAIEQDARNSVGGTPDRVALRASLERAFNKLIDQLVLGIVSDDVSGRY